MADEIKRDFALPYADLIGICDNIHSCMVRDAAELLEYGITNLMTVAFKTKTDEFLAFPTDSGLASDVTIAVDNKNTIASELKIMVRSFGTRAKLAFGDNKGKNDKFVLKDLSHATDRNLLVFCEMVGIEAATYLTEMATAGLTQSMIDDLVDKTNDFRNAMITQSDAVALRDDSSNARTKKANELYGLLTRYSDVGKAIWYETNEALYNDYLIYPGSTSSTLHAPTNLAISLVSGSTSMIQLTYNEVSGAVSYKVYRSVVATGAPAGVFTFVADQVGFVYVGDIVAGSRNYFCLEAVNDTKTSSKSEAVFIDG
jgi:hypothetical protein